MNSVQVEYGQRVAQAEAPAEKERIVAEAKDEFTVTEQGLSLERAEGAKQAQILEAEGRREAAFRDAEARERSAKAEAKATEVVSQAIAKGEVASINYFIADKYLRALTEIVRSPNQKVLMFPIETTSVLGTLGGIAEIIRDSEQYQRELAAAIDRSGRDARPVS
jgi:regulator of protease activity HflC (stomatin/prohibitin superfamily)